MEDKATFDFLQIFWTSALRHRPLEVASTLGWWNETEGKSRMLGDRLIVKFEMKPHSPVVSYQHDIVFKIINVKILQWTQSVITWHMLDPSIT